MFSLNGYTLMSYVHQASSRLPVTVSSAVYRFSLLNLYGLLMFSYAVANSPSVQSLCWPRMYWIACFAVQVVAPVVPVIVAGVISPNMILSFSRLITCSSCTCGVFVL